MKTEKVKLTTAQRNLLKRCNEAVGGVVYRRANERMSAAVLDRLGLAKVEFQEPATLAHAHRPRVYTVAITKSGREAIR